MKGKLITAALAVLGALLGATAIFAQTGEVRYFGTLSKVVTPNGDQKNDLAFFCFDNPSDSAMTGRIYTLLGTEVASTGPKTNRSATEGAGCPSTTFARFVTWDGRSQGVAVRSGVYIYRIEVENRVFSGTLLVVR
jgi:hypothetical protein